MHKHQVKTKNTVLNNCAHFLFLRWRSLLSVVYIYFLPISPLTQHTNAVLIHVEAYIRVFLSLPPNHRQHTSSDSSNKHRAKQPWISKANKYSACIFLGDDEHTDIFVRHSSMYCPEREQLPLEKKNKIRIEYFFFRGGILGTKNFESKLHFFF